MGDDSLTTNELTVAGSSWMNVPADTNLQLDELVFQVTSSALAASGLARHQVGLSVMSSLDLYDGRSISNALTAPAAGGYLNEEFRVEGDAMAGIIAALAALLAGQVDSAIVVGMHVPEIGLSDEQSLRRFRDLVSSYTFDAHCDRPVAMTSEVTLGMHAALRRDQGSFDLDEAACRVARDIAIGALRRGVRPITDARAVREAPVVVEPLTQLMLPATATGVGAVVLAAGALGNRCPNPLARVTGWGMATGSSSSQLGWLDDPGGASARAAARAYQRAGITHVDEEIESLEMTDLSPALTTELLDALQLRSLSPEQINQSGGVRSNFPGNANGLLRFIEAAENVAGQRSRGRAVAHAMDDLSGLVTSTASVLVLEAP